MTLLNSGIWHTYSIYARSSQHGLLQPVKRICLTLFSAITHPLHYELTCFSLSLSLFPPLPVYATCHNSSTSGNWSACSSVCGLGMATRQTSTHAGCHQLSNLRLCENRRCAEPEEQQEVEQHLRDNKKQQQRNNAAHNRPLANGQQQQLERQRQHHKQRQHNLQRWHHQLHQHKRSMQQEPAHRIRVSCDCGQVASCNLHKGQPYLSLLLSLAEGTRVPQPAAPGSGAHPFGRVRFPQTVSAQIVRQLPSRQQVLCPSGDNNHSSE